MNVYILVDYFDQNVNPIKGIYSTKDKAYEVLVNLRNKNLETHKQKYPEIKYIEKHEYDILEYELL